MHERGPSVWCLATGRCGTRTLARVLDLSDDVDAHHDRPPLKPPDWPDGEAIAAERQGRLKTGWSSHGAYAETSPILFHAREEIASKLDRARFIHLHRDPIATVLSGMQAGWEDADSEPAYWEQIHPDECFKWVERCIHAWERRNRRALAFRDEHPDRCLELRSADLYSGNLCELYHLFDWLGFTRPGSLELRETALTRHNYDHLEQRPRPRWDEDWEQLLPYDLMDALGYRV